MGDKTFSGDRWLSVFMISKELLLENTRAIGRPQHRAVIASLELDETKQN